MVQFLKYFNIFSIVLLFAVLIEVIFSSWWKLRNTCGPQVFWYIGGFFFGDRQFNILSDYARRYDVTKIKLSSLKEIKANARVTQKETKCPRR